MEKKRMMDIPKDTHWIEPIKCCILLQINYNLWGFYFYNSIIGKVSKQDFFLSIFQQLLLIYDYDCLI